MARLELLLIFVLQFEGICGLKFCKKPGQDAVMRCALPDPTCSISRWIYSSNQDQTNSPRAARLSVNTECSLVINNITAEDAGLYGCRQARNSNTHVLSVLTNADPKRDGEVTLECSLSRHKLFPCPNYSIRWVDETGAELFGEFVGYRFLGQMDCASRLTVKRQSDHNRKYTCQFGESWNIKIEADYTPDFAGETTHNQTEISNPDPTGVSPLSYVMWTVRVAGLILMIVITVLVIRNKWNTKPLEKDNNVNNGADVQYENVEARPAAARPQ